MADRDGFQTVMLIKDLPPGSQRVVVGGNGRAIAVFHLAPSSARGAQGGVYALANRCVHRGGSIGDGTVTEGQVTCPWHDWSYHVESGRCVDNPQARLKTYPVRIQQGKIQIYFDEESGPARQEPLSEATAMEGGTSGNR